ncbi:TIGR04255 family protein [Crocosphaera sp.]|uniref:TIGR04255 family protein n=1 Tax=Crocosphaera sp. TaxID=2729996 RepID=UPI002637BF8F|nr:TIGR04255 family protein [Crocosphaera sp.]MDJ0579538.1 TIGR04255 family protein [Crocosphaera sp.]
MSEVVDIKNNPLIDPTPSEVHLTNAPLVRVLGQVRFSQILSVENKEFVAQFQEAIRAKYPNLQQQRNHQFTFDNQRKELIPSQSDVIWWFTDINNDWRVSLSSNFIALDTVSYISRQDFLERMKEILTAVSEYIKPNLVERIGIRYIDRLTGDNVKNISNLVIPELTNISTSIFKEHILQTYNESLFQLPNTNEKLLARWGLIPSNSTFDPNTIEPIDEPSWILDLDMSISENQEFKVEKILDYTKRFSERIYTFFRWSVTDEFLSHFGGEK